MNPFTKFLNQWSRDKQLTQWVTNWDRLEALVIQVYRQQTSLEAAQAEFEEVWPWLRQAYSRWEAKLAPYWQRTRIEGQRISGDPFWFLLDLQKPADIVDNWPALQHLPAAREAINHYLNDIAFSE